MHWLGSASPKAASVYTLSSGTWTQLALTGTSNVSAAAVLPDLDRDAGGAPSKESHGRGTAAGQSSIGALYYVVAVVFIYSFSIILLIGSQIRKNKHDRGVSRFCTFFFYEK